MKGFVTLATGNVYYYYLAYNLFKSYKYRGGKYPFAILCDRRNQYTDIFDDIVILENTKSNYFDKFRILIDSPYEENFFIEPDCLIYQNIDIFWEHFKDATDLASYGWNDADLKIFLNADDIEEKYHISTAPLFCPGYMYIKKGIICKKIYDDAISIAEYIIANRQKYPKAFVKGLLRDDPIFFVAMQLNGCKCPVKPKIGKCIHYPSFFFRKHHYPKMNFNKGFLEDDTKDISANLCHFSTKHTRLGKYHQQVAAMNCYISGLETLGKCIESTLVGNCYNVYYKFKSIINRYL